MKKVTRQSVFETNSSSTHSISIADAGDLTDTLAVDEKGTCVICGGTFGWEIEDYYDAASKASYAYVYARDHAPDRTQAIERLCRVVMARTGAKLVQFGSRENDEDEDYGYIDHQSDYVCGEAFESDEKLAAFIFSPKSWLHTDNDNH